MQVLLKILGKDTVPRLNVFKTAFLHYGDYNVYQYSVDSPLNLVTCVKSPLSIIKQITF